MLALPIRRVSEPDDGGYQIVAGPVVADAGPQPALPGRALARREHRHWRVVGMELIRAQDVPAHRIDQGTQQGRRFAHPVGQGRTRQLNARAGINLGLAIERQVVRSLRDQDVRQQPRTGQASRDRTARRRRLHDLVAAAAGLFGPEVTDDAKVGGNVLQPLRNVLAQRFERTAAIGADRRFWEYERRGTANLFPTSEPLTGHRHVTVTARRMAVDFAREVRDLLEVRYPHAEKVVLVMDDLNTHKPAAPYRALEPKVARSPIDRPEIHRTPQHGGWLNMAKIELSVLSRQCPDRRIPDVDTLPWEVVTWERASNACPHPANWRFTTPDARVQVKTPLHTIQSG
jgi:hypothetical protein